MCSSLVVSEVSCGGGEVAHIQQPDPMVGIEQLTPNVRDILLHLCSGPIEGRTYGLVVEWCETRGDCTYGVVCTETGLQFVIDDAELAELQRWTDEQGNALVCGVRWD